MCEYVFVKQFDKITINVGKPPEHNISFLIMIIIIVVVNSNNFPVIRVTYHKLIRKTMTLPFLHA